MDWTKNACLLCSRGFKDAETMQKHRSFSNLHIQNLNKLRAKYGLREVSAASQPQAPSGHEPPQHQSHAATIASLMQLGAAAASSHAKSVAANKQAVATSGGGDDSPPSGGRYRDRARERREKFGTVPPPPRGRAEPDMPPTAGPPGPSGFGSVPPPPTSNGKIYVLN